MTKKPWYETRKSAKRFIDDVTKDIGSDFAKPLFGRPEMYLDSDSDRVVAMEYVHKHYGESYV